MSDELILSDELIGDVRAAMAQYDPRANEGLVGVQYAAAVLGYMLGEMDMAPEAKMDIFNRLGGFAHDIMKQVEERNAPEPEVAEEALGVWRPGDQ